MWISKRLMLSLQVEKNRFWLSCGCTINPGDLAGLENLKSEPNKMILWQCQEKQISTQMALANW